MMSDAAAGRGSTSASRSLTPEQQLWQLWRQGSRPSLEEFLHRQPGLPPAEVAGVIGIDQYERWRTGESVPAEHYLALLPEGAGQDQAACDVIYGEFLLCEQLGKKPDPESFLRRFPDYAPLIRRQLEVHRGLGLDLELASSASEAPAVTIRSSAPPGPVKDDLPRIPGYEVLRVIGRGGMGTVYQARQLSLDRIVALKVLDRRPEDDPASLERKRREAQNTARLSHPNIVTVFDAALTDSLFYLAMEYIEGTDLHRLVEQDGPLPVAKACNYILQAALGLRQAHERGVIHRDVKPSNFIVSRGEGDPDQETVKVLDLGLALDVESTGKGAPLTQLGTFLGTPDYIAPEQANDAHRVDARSDLYSLGCTFYFLLAGHPPFRGATPLAKLMQHQLEDPVPIETLRPDVPLGVANILRRSMAKKPENRYQTAGEMVEALLLVVRGNVSPQAAPGPAPVPAFAPLIRESPIRKLEGHTDWIKGLAFSPSGTWLASASLDRTIRCWRVGASSPISPRSWASRGDSSEAEGWKIEGHLGGVYALAFSPDGRMLASGGEDQALHLHSLESRRAVWEQQGHRECIDCLGFTPGGDRILSGAHDGELRLWHTERGDVVRAWKGHEGPVWGLALTPDGRAALTGGQDRSLRLWDLATGESLAVLPEQSMLVTGLAISPDGALAITGGVDGVLHLWDLARLRETRSLQGHEGRITGVAFAPDGRRAVTGSRDRTVRVWDLETGRELGRFVGHTRWVTAVAWVGRGGLIASGCVDRSVWLWREEGGDRARP